MYDLVKIDTYRNKHKGEKSDKATLYVQSGNNQKD